MTSSSRSKTVTAARLLLGLGFFVFGLNGFFGFLPSPQHTGAAAAYLGGLFAAGYMFPFIKGTEVLVGTLLLSNRLVPLALTILAPVMLNIMAFHLFLDSAGIALPAVLMGLQLYLAYSHRAAYAPLFAVRSTRVAADRRWSQGDSYRGHATAPAE
ncbi:MAG TPA: DoxX family protein [Polyangiaceae bacterium]|nr:DoxX family protein [Polyangiaceae bacterium]